MFTSKYQPSERFTRASLRVDIVELLGRWNPVLEDDPSEENYMLLTREIYSKMGIDVDEPEFEALIRESSKLAAEGAALQHKYDEFEARMMPKVESMLEELEEDS